jgi:nucleotide-binding universal stress UspA family protein
MVAKGRNILIGYDGSDSGRRALATAVELAGYGSTIAVTAVSSGNGHGPDPKTVLAEARDELLRRHVLARYLDGVGDSDEALADAARAIGADLLVIGRAGLRGTLADAPCDLLVVR